MSPWSWLWSAEVAGESEAWVSLLVLLPKDGNNRWRHGWCLFFLQVLSVSAGQHKKENQKKPKAVHQLISKTFHLSTERHINHLIVLTQTNSYCY